MSRPGKLLSSLPASACSYEIALADYCFILGEIGSSLPFDILMREAASDVLDRL